MLCGHPPFRIEGRTSETLYEAVQRELKFPADEWDHVSAEAKDLVRSLLTVDPSRRITPQV